MSDIAISIKGLSKYYKLYKEPKDMMREAFNPFGKKYHHEFYALKNINLEINKGEILGIVGKNGSGKSTLLKLICGVLSPNSGNIVVNGKIAALLELGAGFNPEFTGLNNIYFYATILGLSNKEIDEKIDDIIAFADLGRFINQPIKTYSSGMKARLGFAVAVHIDPEILILDEVMAVGDIFFRRKCYAKMEEFFKGGKTIIYVSHDINSINQLCTRALLLDGGKLLLDSDAKAVSMFYQRLLFAKQDEKSQEIVNELANQAPNQQKTTINNSKNMDKKDKTGAYYVDGFLPEKKVQYQNRNIEILDVNVLTLNGNDPVNHLIKGEKYKLIFTVLFREGLSFVKFGCSIKNEKGFIVSGYTLPGRAAPIREVREGDRYSAVACFTASFAAGIYYFDVGVSSDESEEKVFLIRVHDILCIKVLTSDQDSWGLVNVWDKSLCSISKS